MFDILGQNLRKIALRPHYIERGCFKDVCLYRGNGILAARSGAATVNEIEVNSGLNTFEGIVVKVLKGALLEMSKAEISDLRTYHGKRGAAHHFLRTRPKRCRDI